MSTATSDPAGAAAHAPSASSPSGAPPARDTCPLCGSPLAGEQEWCLRCGAAARTRLAAPPNWKAPVAAVAVVVALSLGVLAASLVKLAGNSSAAPTTTTIVTAAAAGASSSTPGALASTAPGAATSTQGAAGAPKTGTTKRSTTPTISPQGKLNKKDAELYRRALKRQLEGSHIPVPTGEP